MAELKEANNNVNYEVIIIVLRCVKYFLRFIL